MAEKRIDRILAIIKEQGYVTVKYLCETLNYSTATINRDLNDLQKQKLIVRHYGGAELVKRKSVPLAFRYHKMRPAKRSIAKKAASLIQSGMTVFIDGTTTTHYIGDYIKNIADLTVITNNINLASHLSEAGVKCICLGGQIVEPPYMTGGPDTVRHAQSYTADLAFFSAGGISDDGKIYAELYYDLSRTFIENSRRCVFMIDRQKLNIPWRRILCTVADIDVVVTDLVFSDEVKRQAPNTEFIEVETPKTQR